MSSSSIPQPVVVYPNSVPSAPPSHSKGSFGPVFIVLSVIIVLAMIACFVGRICSRRLPRPKAKHGRPPVRGKGDLEDGFEISFQTPKRAANGESREGGIKGEAKPAANGEVRPSA